MENNEQINNSKFDLASFKKSQENMIVKNNAVDLIGSRRYRHAEYTIEEVDRIIHSGSL
ncbi:MAG: hypothetical protein IJH65_04565 [Methanobrevibacter sp.]|nr:hypothetical protein [Methanobrevibacter sp.]